MTAPAAVLRVTTRLVVVDVVAADKKGQAVRDLAAEDFTLLEDGKPQRIRIFSFQHPPQREDSPAPPRPRSLPANVVTNIPSYDNNSALNIILLDGLNTAPSNQMYARQQMLKYLDTIPEGQPIAVYTLGRRLQLVVDFTGDVGALKDALKKVRVDISPLLARREVEAEGLPMPVQMQLLLEEWARETLSLQTDARVRNTLDALKSLARAVSGYSGRKNLIWISETFPITIAPNPKLGLDKLDSARDYETEVIAMAEALADAQVAVYAVDARGLPSPARFDAGPRGNRAAEDRRIDDEEAALLASHDTMKELAARTGGKAFYNRNDLDEAIRNSMDDGSTYYTLAYYPENKDWNGKFRQIQVRINRPGVQLRHRTGYYAFDPKNAGNPKERFSSFGQALSLDFPISTGLRFEAGVVPPSQKTSKVMVNFAVDPRGLSFERSDDESEHAKVDCAVRAFTTKGQMVKTEASTVNPALKPDAYAQLMHGLFYCHQSIELPAGDYVLRLGVLDQYSGLMGTANAKVSVASTIAHGDRHNDATKP